MRTRSCHHLSIPSGQRYSKSRQALLGTFQKQVPTRNRKSALLGTFRKQVPTRNRQSFSIPRGNLLLTDRRNNKRSENLNLLVFKAPALSIFASVEISLSPLATGRSDAKGPVKSGIIPLSRLASSRADASRERGMMLDFTGPFARGKHAYQVRRNLKTARNPSDVSNHSMEEVAESANPFNFIRWPTSRRVYKPLGSNPRTKTMTSAKTPRLYDNESRHVQWEIAVVDGIAWPGGVDCTPFRRMHAAFAPRRMYWPPSITACLHFHLGRCKSHSMGQRPSRSARCHRDLYLKSHNQS